MNQQLPRIALVLLVAASLTVTLAGARAVSDIIGPTVLALVLTITVHPCAAASCGGGWRSGSSRWSR